MTLPEKVDLRAFVSVPYHRQVITFYSYKGGVGRSMALAHVAALLSRRNIILTDNRIICVDLDLDAPGLPNLLPSRTAKRRKGILGMILDTDDPSDPELHKQLGRMLADEETYKYQVVDAPNLFVLPAGDLSSKQRLHAIRKLNDWLLDQSDADDNGRKFFTALREALRTEFTYALVDARTGLADVGAATTNILADAMVLLFRPNAPQLIAVQEVLSNFLHAHGAHAKHKDAPVIPVLSPRPSFSSPRLTAFRRLATSHLFKWLRPPLQRGEVSAYRRNRRMIELPTDFSLHLEERLLIATNDAMPEDSSAPLFRAYSALTDLIQRGNARNDPLGAELIERAFLRDSDKSAAFEYAMASLTLLVRDAATWDDITDEYREHFSDDNRALSRFLGLCDTILQAFEPNEYVARGFAGAAWSDLVVANEQDDPHAPIGRTRTPELVAARLNAAWDDAAMSQNGTLARGVMERTRRVALKRNIPGLPDHIALTEALALERFLEAGEVGTVASLWETLLDLEEAYDTSSEYSDLLIDVLTDQYRIAEATQILAPVLLDRADANLASMHFRKAAGDALAAFRHPGAPPDARDEAFTLLCRVVPRIELKKMAAALYRDCEDAQLLYLKLRLGETPAGMQILQAPLAHEGHANGAETLILYSYLEHSDALHALAFLKTVTNRTKRLTAIEAVLKWLVNDEPVDDDFAHYAHQVLGRDTVHSWQPLDSASVALLLAHSPRSLGRHAERNRHTATWPMEKEGWRLLSAFDPKHGAPVVESSMPSFASRYVIEGNTFQILRLVVNKLAQKAEFPEIQNVAAKLSTLFVTWYAEPQRERNELEQTVVPGPIRDILATEFLEFVNRWQLRLAPRRNDPKLARLLDVMLSPSVRH